MDKRLGPYPPPDVDTAEKYDVWFRQKVQQALDDKRPGIPHDQVVAEMRERMASAKTRRNKKSA